MNLTELRSAFSKYVPAKALDSCIDWIAEHRISVRITRSRHTKYGDYRPPFDGKGHRISINHDLNKYAFLLTFTHEVAHLITYNKYRLKVDPHGREWKHEFKKIMTPLLFGGIFPRELVLAINNYISNPAASSCSDIELMRTLSKYDKRDQQWKLLEELRLNTHFRIRTGREFIKGELKQKNFCCTCVKSRHQYFINPLTEVQVVRPGSGAPGKKTKTPKFKN
ncbi:MAG TPA: SprT-like domain-containing protein [Bacteroidia bacterium]|nr:SprT-like domain-containing protein [Bacteroidia bacterium]